MTTEPNNSCTGGYWNGCRCPDCRTSNTMRARDLRERRRENITSDADHIPADPSRKAIGQMRAAGLTWNQVTLITASDRTTLQRIYYRERQWVTRGCAERIAAAAAYVAEHPEPATIEATMVDSRFTRWMVSALMANGWTSAWIGEQIGWKGARCTPRDVADKRVHIEFETRMKNIFDRYAHTRGPSWQTTMTTLRKGSFPAACYDWEEEHDLRPIPGALHPDLVQLAARSRRKEITDRVLRDMAGWGQWPSERCASTAMHLWAEATGRTIDNGPGAVPLCRTRRHDHTPPAIWTTGNPGPAIAS